MELNAETLPRVLVNNAYFTEIRRSSLREGAMKTANGQNGNGKTGQSKAEGEQAF